MPSIIPVSTGPSCDPDGDGEPNVTDPDDNDPCTPVASGPTCDPDGDGEPNATDPDDNDPCVPVASSACDVDVRLP